MNDTKNGKCGHEHTMNRSNGVIVARLALGGQSSAHIKCRRSKAR